MLWWFGSRFRPWESGGALVSLDGEHYPLVVPEMSSDHISPSSFAF